jgi:hypothetical protein
MSLNGLLRLVNASKKVLKTNPTNAKISSGFTAGTRKIAIRLSGENLDYSSVDRAVSTAEKRVLAGTDSVDKQDRVGFDLSPADAAMYLAACSDQILRGQILSEDEKAEAKDGETVPASDAPVAE